MPSLVIDWTKRHWEKISLNDRAVILKDLKQFINSGMSLGDDCDHVAWMNFHEWILEQRG